MRRQSRKKGVMLRGTRVYLSGPMDFVASRSMEERFGWRTRVREFLHDLGATVFDPWVKPDVRWFHEFGKEQEDSQDEIRRLWTYEPGPAGQEARAWCARRFWETLHIDLRMVDTSDFVIAYCPTTIYSVGTVHEIVMARLQRKPVLLVTPSVSVPELDQLRTRIRADKKASELLERLLHRVPVKPNPDAIPSLWYMPLLGGHNFFDGFGFDDYRKEFRWKEGPLDAAEEESRPRRPLLPLLRQLSLGEKPSRYSLSLQKEMHDDDWLVWDFEANVISGGL